MSVDLKKKLLAVVQAEEFNERNDGIWEEVLVPTKRSKFSVKSLGEKLSRAFEGSRR